MSEQLLFALRMGAATSSSIVFILSFQQLFTRARRRRFDMAFYLAISCCGMALGAASGLMWNSLYMYTKLTGHPEKWMLTAPFVAYYLSIFFASTVTLLYALAIPRQRFIGCLLAIVCVMAVSYLSVSAF